MGFAVIVGAFLAGGFEVISNSRLVLIGAYLIGFVLTGSSMILNDYADQKIDAINEPTRPLPSGAISPRVALAYGLFLMILGLSLALIIGFVSFLAAIVAWLLFLAYTLVGKRTGLPGNVLVSICVATPFLYGAIVIGSNVEPRIVIFASIAFLANLGREVIKGIVDIGGDRSKGVRTVAVRFGADSAARLAVFFLLLAVGLSALPPFWQMVTAIYYLPFVLVTDLGLGFTAFSILRSPSREKARAQKKFVLLWMVFGLLAFLAGSV